jgi:hypothetical protein
VLTGPVFLEILELLLAAGCGSEGSLELAEETMDHPYHLPRRSPGAVSHLSPSGTFTSTYFGYTDLVEPLNGQLSTTSVFHH